MINANVIESYKMSYKFNASHNTSGTVNGNHMHTFRLIVFINKTSNDFVDFYTYEKEIIALVNKYKGNCFNDFEEFKDISPTVENICIYFYTELTAIFNNTDLLSLDLVEFGDSPTQSFTVASKYIIRDLNREYTKQELEELINKGIKERYRRTYE